MKNLGWGDAFIAAGILVPIAAIALAFSGSAGPLLGAVLVIASLIGGVRLVIKGIHQKAAAIQARR